MNINGDNKNGSFKGTRAVKSGHRVMLIGLALSTAIFAFAHQSQAVLGGPAGSVESDRAVLKAAPGVTSSGNGYTVHEMTSSPSIVREYISPSGIIFAIAWNGLATPDLSQLLGAYASEYQKALQQTPRQRGARHLHVESQNIIVEKWGHMRALHGRAYVPALIPPGVSTDAIR